MNIVFLDIDGVISPNDTIYDLTEKLFHELMFNPQIHDQLKYEPEYRQWLTDEILRTFDRECVSRLINFLDQTQSKIVVHSTWRRMPGQQITEYVLRCLGLESYFHENLYAPMKLSSDKAHDIGMWLAENSCDRYCIFEDLDIYAVYYEIDPHKKDHLFLISDPDRGLQDNDVAEFLGRWDHL